MAHLALSMITRRGTPANHSKARRWQPNQVATWTFALLWVMRLSAKFNLFLGVRNRGEEFGPIKNATGVDSVESSKALQTARAAAWLEACGVAVPRKPDGSPDCTLEISPATATCSAELAKTPLPTSIDRGARLAL